MGRVQKYAEGFLSLIGNKIGGREPTVLSDVVMPTVDMTELFHGRRLSADFVFTAADTSLGASATFTVPEGKIWLLKGVSTTVGLISTTTFVVFRCALSKLNVAPGTNVFVMGSNDFQDKASAATRNVTQAKTFETPWIMTPGQQVIFDVCETSATTRPWSALIAYYELEA